MARLPKNALPSLRHHKASGQGVVTLNGRDFYLGDRTAPGCEERYNAIIARWISNGRRLIDGPRDKAADEGGITIVELIARYVEFAEARYDGRRGTVLNVSRALSVLRTLFGRDPVSTFGPKALRTYQRALIELKPQQFKNGAAKRDGPLARKTVNYHTGIVKRMFKWAKNEELIPPSVFEAIRDVPWLRVGETRARETAPVRPVPDAIVEETIPFMPPTVADMIRLQRLTGMRPAEVCAMTTRAIDTSGKLWRYNPVHHKTAIHGKERVIDLGPRAQEIVGRYLHPELDKPLFSPWHAEEERRAIKRAARKTKVQPSQMNRRKPNRERPPGDRYDSASYRRAVANACDLAFPHPETSKVRASRRTPEQVEALRRWKSEHRWAPNQLRHARATEVRREMGIEAAQAVLGHSKIETTQIYAERQRQLAERAALATG